MLSQPQLCVVVHELGAAQKQPWVGSYNKADLLIGRASDCDIILPSPLVSKRHARLHALGGQAVLSDLGSSNGTHVNNKLLTGSCPVRAEDEILIGVFKLRISVATPAQPEAPQRRPLRALISYAPADERHRDSLFKHLTMLRQAGLLLAWHDHMVTAGADQEQRVMEQIEQAELVLPLISSDYLGSEHCMGKELARALSRHRRGLVRIVPILVRPVIIDTSRLADLQALPSNGCAVSLWSDADAAWVHVVSSLQRTLQETA